MKDIVEELRKEADHDFNEGGFAYDLLRRAANEIAALRIQMETLQKELRDYEKFS